MGGSGGTKKSLEDVKNDLLNTLLTNARALLKKDFNITDTTSSMEDVLKKIAVNRFASTYQYAYDDIGSKVNPPNSLGDVRTSAKICSIIPPIGTQVNEYLKAGVFSKLDLPQWMEQTAITDLCTIANVIIAKDTEKQWKYNEYRRTYDARKEDQDTFKCNSILVYVNGSLVEDGTQANLAVIYYVGVYYKTTSETKGTRDGIQGEAYKTTAGLTGKPAPNTDGKLKDSLDGYCGSKFADQFKFGYGTVPPDSYRAQGIDSAFITQNSQLCYIPDLKVDDLSTYIEHQVYSGLNIPLPSVRTQAKDDTFNEYKSILQNASTDSWNLTRLDKTYIPADPTNNPIRQVGIIMSWYDHKTTDTQVSISVTYIYIMTMFYECQNADQELSQELFKVLCNNLRRHILGNDSTDIADPALLKEFLKSYAMQEFNKAFEFPYDGKKTNPPDKKTGGKVDSYEELLQLKTYPSTREEVESWMDAEVFKRTDIKFPPFAMAPIYDDVRDHMLRYGGTATPKDNNWWYTANFTNEYLDPSPNKRDLKQYAFYVYALGDMTLNKRIGGQEGVHVKRLFVYYLGVFCSFDPGSW